MGLPYLYNYVGTVVQYLCTRTDTILGYLSRNTWSVFWKIRGSNPGLFCAKPCIWTPGQTSQGNLDSTSTQTLHHQPGSHEHHSVSWQSFKVLLPYTHYHCCGVPFPQLLSLQLCMSCCTYWGYISCCITDIPISHGTMALDQLLANSYLDDSTSRWGTPH